MFKLDRNDAKLTRLNVRSENHGDEHRPACDVFFNVEVENTHLDLLHPEIRGLLYKKKPLDEQDLAEQGQEHDETELRFNELTKLDWEYIGMGYRMIIWSSVTDYEDVVLIDTKISKFKITCEQSGWVSIEFKVAGYPNEKDMGRLYTLLNSGVELTLEPPSAEHRAQMDIDEAA